MNHTPTKTCEGSIIDKKGEVIGDEMFHKRDMLTNPEEEAADLEALRASIAPSTPAIK